MLARPSTWVRRGRTRPRGAGFRKDGTWTGSVSSLSDVRQREDRAKSRSHAIVARAMSYPTHRPRRLRRTAALRRLVAETRPTLDGLVLPLFVAPGSKRTQPIAAM